MLIFEERAVPAQKEKVFRYLMSGQGAPIYVLGRNKYAQRFARVVPVQAFIDDFTEEKIYMGRPVIRMADLTDDCIVVSCVVDARSLTALNRLQSVGVRKVIDYFMLSRLAPEAFEPVDYCVRNRQDILENLMLYKQVYNRLADDTSRETFTKVVRFRLSMDLEHMRGFSYAIDRQYFEDFLPFRKEEVFVDGGGYDGKTTLQFAARNKDYRRIYFFEPLPPMMEVSQRNLTFLRDILFKQKGLFSRNDRLRFDMEAGPASSLSASGQIEIGVVRLDDEVQEPITFIKLDIEGAEYEALNGAEEHIRSETPKMAVCVYHDQRDFWRIPLRVLEINDRYKVYVRHYSEGILETVMFFAPQ